MKKTKKKLTLAKETVRNLEREQLGLAVGALYTETPSECPGDRKERRTGCCL
jgi:hypothetical protein